jgi:hypothetical protein
MGKVLGIAEIDFEMSRNWEEEDFGIRTGCLKKLNFSPE